MGLPKAILRFIFKNMVAKRLEPFLSYPFAELDRAKAEAINRGVSVIDFGVGDPESFPPEEIVDILAFELNRSDAYRYPSYEGERELRESFCEFFSWRYGVNLDPERECLVLIGSKEGIAHLPLAIVNPGEFVALPDPGYPVYAFGASIAGAKLLPLNLREENNWLPDLSLLAKNNVRLWYLNYPSNPTTALASLDFLEEVIRIARQKGIVVVNDAAYSEIYFDTPPRSILEVREAKKVAVEFHSASKTFGIPGVRVGFLVGNDEIVRALSVLKKNIDSGQFKPIQRALAYAYRRAEIMDGIRSLYRHRRDLFVGSLVGTLFDGPAPEATFYIWRKIPHGFGVNNSRGFTKFLIEKLGIIVLPGVGMGEGGEGYIRFSLTLPEPDIIEGCRRLASLTRAAL